jgi:hypothetical protein
MRRALLGSLIATSALVVAIGFIARRVPMVALIAAAVALLALPGVVVARRDRVAASAIVIAALVLAPVLVVPTYLIAHPMVHIDNATNAPVDIWIDGVRVLTVGPSLDGEPPHIRVPFGTHRLAWSPPNGSPAAHETDVELRPLDAHLYTPGPGCYWLAVTAYGGASTHGTEHGPMPLRDFHRLDRVDVWFGDTPARVRTPRLASGTIRVAIQRWKQCNELTVLGCDGSQRQTYVDCVRTIDGRGTAPDCWAEATRACQKPSAQPANVAQP